MLPLKIIFISCVIPMGFTLTACGNSNVRDGTFSESRRAGAQERYSSQQGYISNIEVIRAEASETSGRGAVLGAVVGGVIGNQVGNGRGRAAATGAGVVGGAIVGNSLEKRNTANAEIYRVTVEFDDGRQGQYDYQLLDDLRIGDRVKIVAGQIRRI